MREQEANPAGHLYPGASFKLGEIIVVRHYQLRVEHIEGDRMVVRSVGLSERGPVQCRRDRRAAKREALKNALRKAQARKG